MEQGLPVRRVQRDPQSALDVERWPATLAPVRQLLAEGLDLGPATVLVGENGSGKSTLVEAVAMAFGLPGEGGTTHHRHATWGTESDLHHALQLVRGAGASRWGYFLRAETMHGLLTDLTRRGSNPRRPDPAWHEMSHGESFLAVLEHRFDDSGLYVLDEPESALSFTGQLALVGTLAAQVSSGRAQVLVATHSPVVASLPGARILQVGPGGLTETSWEDLEVVQHWRAFLDAPGRYLRHLT